MSRVMRMHLRIRSSAINRIAEEGDGDEEGIEPVDSEMFVKLPEEVRLHALLGDVEQWVLRTREIIHVRE